MVPWSVIAVYFHDGSLAKLFIFLMVSWTDRFWSDRDVYFLMVPWSDRDVYFPDGFLIRGAVYFPDGSLISQGCSFSWWFPDKPVLFIFLMVPRLQRAVHFPDGSLITKGCLFPWWFPEQTGLFISLMVPWSDRAVYFPDNSLIWQGCIFPWSDRAVYLLVCGLFVQRDCLFVLATLIGYPTTQPPLSMFPDLQLFSSTVILVLVLLISVSSDLQQ